MIWSDLNQSVGVFYKFNRHKDSFLKKKVHIKFAFGSYIFLSCCLQIENYAWLHHMSLIASREIVRWSQFKFIISFKIEMFYIMKHWNRSNCYFEWYACYLSIKSCTNSCLKCTNKCIEVSFIDRNFISQLRCLIMMHRVHFPHGMNLKQQSANFKQISSSASHAYELHIKLLLLHNTSVDDVCIYINFISLLWPKRSQTTAIKFGCNFEKDLLVWVLTAKDKPPAWLHQMNAAWLGCCSICH